MMLVRNSRYKKKERTPLLCLKPMLLFSLFLLSSITLKAQVGEFRSELALGGSAGITMSSVSFDPTIKQKQLIGKTAGVTFRYTCEKYFKTICALQVELNYAELGWKEDIMDSKQNPIADTYEYSIKYLQLPMLTKLGWGREHRGFMFYIMAGPQLSYCFSEAASKSAFTLNDEGQPDRPNGVFQQYNKKVENKIDYGITAGLGIELSTKIGDFDIEGLYYYGLGDIYGNSKKDPFSRSANQAILIKCAYLLPL